MLDEVFAGQTKSWTLTCELAGARQSLVGCQVTFEVKKHDEDPDPPLIEKSIGSGITLLPDSGDTVGQATVVLDPLDTFGPLAPPFGNYRASAWVTFPDGTRTPVVKPDDLVIRPPLVMLPDPPFFLTAAVV